MHCYICLYVWAFTAHSCHMDSNPSPPRIKAQERDANGHSYSSNPVKVGESRKVDLTKPGAYSKQIETPFRDLWVHKYQYLH